MIGRMSRGQRLAHAKRSAQSEARFNILRHASGDGLTKREAAARAGLSENGVDTLLYKKLGSSKWPLAEQEAGADE